MNRRATLAAVAAGALLAGCASGATGVKSTELRPLFVTADASLEREQAIRHHFVLLCTANSVARFQVKGYVDGLGKTFDIETNLPQRATQDTDLQRKMNRFTWPVHRESGQVVNWPFEQTVVCPSRNPLED